MREMKIEVCEVEMPEWAKVGKIEALPDKWRAFDSSGWGMALFIMLASGAYRVRIYGYDLFTTWSVGLGTYTVIRTNYGNDDGGYIYFHGNLG